MVAHWFVEVNGIAARHIKASDPHGTDEDHPERIIWVLELLLHILLHHAQAVRFEVDPFFGEKVQLVLCL